MIASQQHKPPKLCQEKNSLQWRLAHRAQQLFYLSGITYLYTRRYKHDWGIILMYHSVADTQIAPYIDPKNSIMVEQFESQLILLHESFKVISLSELITCLQDKKPLSKNTVVITFDDGYLDNLVNAAPLLAKYQMPATLFLPTRYIESAEPQWIDRLYISFQFRSKHKLSLKQMVETFNLRDQIQLEQAYKLHKKILLTAGFKEREWLLKQIEEQLEPSVSPPHLTLNWNDVRRLKDEYPLFEIGVHTRNHQDLTSLEDNQAEYEIRQSRQDYKKELGYEPQLFSYPYGRYNEINRTKVESSAFLGAVSTQPTYRINKSTDRYALPRLDSSKSLLDLKVWLSGAFPELSISLWGKACD